MSSGIYTITNKVNGKIYVGFAKNFNERFSNHKKDLRKNKAKNIHLQNAWNKYREENFLFEILEEWEESFLSTMEHYWCLLLNTHDRKYGYNIRPTSHNNKTRLSICTIQKIKKANTGKKHKPETIALLKKIHKGKIVSKETRLKMSNAAKGRKLSEETRKKRLGRNVSEETRIKLSIANKGKKRTDEVKKHLSLIRKGKIWSEERKKSFIYKPNRRIPLPKEELNLIRINKGKLVGKLEKTYLYKKIVQEDDTGNVVKIFDSIKQACDLFCCKRISIARVLSGERKTYKNYKFKYYGE